jgi:hypothetical protein
MLSPDPGRSPEFLEGISVPNFRDHAHRVAARFLRGFDGPSAVQSAILEHWTGEYLKSQRNQRCHLSAPLGPTAPVLAVRAFGGGLGNSWSNWVSMEIVGFLLGTRRTDAERLSV